MKPGPLGIYYLSYGKNEHPKSARKWMIGYSKQDYLDKLEVENIPEDYFCVFEECRTPGILIKGTIKEVRAWIQDHMPEKYGEPLR